MKSWKTTLAGIMSFITLSWTQVQFLLDTDPLTNPDWGIIIGAVTVLSGLLFARDNDVTSKEAGAER